MNQKKHCLMYAIGTDIYIPSEGFYELYYTRAQKKECPTTGDFVWYFDERGAVAHVGVFTGEKVRSFFGDKEHLHTLDDVLNFEGFCYFYERIAYTSPIAEDDVRAIGYEKTISR